MTSWDGHVPGKNDPAGYAGHEPPSRHAGNAEGTWPHQHDQASRARGRRGTNWGRNLTLAVVAVLVLAGLGGFGYALAHRHHVAPPPAGAGQTGPTVGQQNPGKVVVEYFSDINQHRYQAAWQLRGQRGSLAGFEHGLVGTEKDAVTIIHVNGSVVTAELQARQTDGTVKVFEGTYTVMNGMISYSNVHLVKQS